MPKKITKKAKTKTKKKKLLANNVQAEFLHSLGLEPFLSAPLDSACMLNISTWTSENLEPLETKDLPFSFLQRLWLLSPDARSTCCKGSSSVLNNASRSAETLNGLGGEDQQTIHPLDLVTAVYMSANPFIQQEMTARMMQCQFAVPLVLPSKDPEGPGRFLLWPLRNVVTQWKSHSVQDLASRSMPMVSFIKFGHLGVSKSQVLNCITRRPGSCTEMFLHREMEGGHLPRRLANGLVEIGWRLPTGGNGSNGFPAPMAICNLRGDATKHEQCLTFLCQASSVVVVFCGKLLEKEKQILASCNNLAKKLIVVDVSQTEKNVKSNLGLAGMSFGRTTGIPKESVLQGKGLNVEEIAKSVCNTLKNLIPTELTHVSMVQAAKTATDTGLEVDEGDACKKALGMVEEVLEGLGDDLGEFKQKQLPLQGFFWKKLGEIERTECKSRIERKPLDPQLRREKKYILAEFKRYKITQSMKIFINAMSATDKVERAYFLRWLKLKLKLKQGESQGIQPEPFSFVHTENNVPEEYEELQNGFAENLSFSDYSSANSTSEGENLEEMLGVYVTHLNKQPNRRTKAGEAADGLTAEDIQLDPLPKKSKSTFLEKNAEQQNEPKLKPDPNILLNEEGSCPDLCTEPQKVDSLQTLESHTDWTFSDLIPTKGVWSDVSTEPQKVDPLQTSESNSSADLTRSQDRLYPDVPKEPPVVDSLFTSKSNSFSDLVITKDVIGPDSTESQKVDSLQTLESHSWSDLTIIQDRISPDASTEPQKVGSLQTSQSDSSADLTKSQDMLYPAVHNGPLIVDSLYTSKSNSFSDLAITKDVISPDVSSESQKVDSFQTFSDLTTIQDGIGPDASTEPQKVGSLWTSESDSSADLSDLSPTKDVWSEVSTEPRKVDSLHTLESDSCTDLRTAEDRLYQAVPNGPLVVDSLNTSKSNSFSDLVLTKDVIGPDVSTEPQKVDSLQSLESDSSADLKTTQDRVYPDVPKEPLVVGSPPTSKSSSPFLEKNAKQQNEPKLKLDPNSQLNQDVSCPDFSTDPQKDSLQTLESHTDWTFSDLITSKNFWSDVSPEPRKVDSLQTSGSDSSADLTTTQDRLYPDVPNGPLAVGSPQNLKSSSTFPDLTNQDSLQPEPQIGGPLQTLESHSSSHLTTTHDCLCPEPQILGPLQAHPSSDLRATHDCMCPDVSTEVQVPDTLQTITPIYTSLGLEHFLREMGLIFELTCNNFGSRSQNVLGLPVVAADLLLYGVPLEIMDGNASNIPMNWLGCVLAELNRRLPQQKYKVRVLTNLGVHYAWNAEVLSTIFGVKFPERARTSRGVYMLLLRLPDNVRQQMRCDFLLFLNVSGFGSTSQDNTVDTRIHDHEMVAVAAGMTDVLMHNVSPHTGAEFESDLTVIANALLCIQQYVPMPSCQLLVHDDDVNSMLHGLQLKHVCEVLQGETGSTEANNADKQNTKAAPCITCVKGPWSSASPFGPVDRQYSTAVLRFKKTVFGTLEKWASKSAATGLADFFVRLNSLWEVVKEDAFYIGLQNSDAAKAFPGMCTEVAQWQENLLDHIESWFEAAEKNIIDTKENALDEEDQNDLLSELKEDARDEIKTKARKIKTRMNTYIRKSDVLKEKGESFRPLVISYVDHLQEQVTENTIQRLEKANESHCSSMQLNRFRTLLEKEQEAEFDTLMRKSNSTNALLQDEQLEEEFEGMWSKIVSTFGFRPAEREDITLRVRNILIQNLVSRGLQKHIKRTEAIFFYYMCSFRINDDYLKYRSRVSNIIQRRKDAEKLACAVVEEYNQFVAEKFSLPACYSESYIKDILGIVEKALQRSSLQFRTAFEVDLKVYLCSAACQDFQRLHERFDKDEQLLTYMSVNKSAYMSKFVYQFRKNDQCQRVAEAFMSMIIKPTVLHYIYSLVGSQIVEEIQSQHQQYQSSRTFSQSLMETLITEVRFERFWEFLHSYNSYRQKRIQETVLSHLSESTTLNEWRQDRLCEIVKIITSALNQTTLGTQGVLSDTKPLLEKVCIIIENDANIGVSSAALNGPLFSITTDWTTFVTCLKKLLAEMQADLNQEFSQSVDVTQLLRCLPCDPQKSLFSKVQGCEQCCPHCKAPCQEVEVGHDVHRALLHRPRYMLPNVRLDDGSESETQSELEQNQDADDLSVTCGNLLSIYPDWTMCADQNDQTPSPYWRFVVARFNEDFAKEYKKMPVEVPAEWKDITQEEALNSLKDIYQ